jgi:hypothetical protein
MHPMTNLSIVTSTGPGPRLHALPDQPARRPTTPPPSLPAGAHGGLCPTCGAPCPGGCNGCRDDAFHAAWQEHFQPLLLDLEVAMHVPPLLLYMDRSPHATAGPGCGAWGKADGDGGGGMAACAAAAAEAAEEFVAAAAAATTGRAAEASDRFLAAQGMHHVHALLAPPAPLSSYPPLPAPY